MFFKLGKSLCGAGLLMAGVFLLGLTFVTPSLAGSVSTSLEIDLDRGTPGVQTELLNFVSGGTVQGAVVVVGDEFDTVKDYAVEIQFARQQAGDAINCGGTTLGAGEITSAFGSQLCQNSFFRKANLFVNPGVSVGSDNILVVFTFDAVVNVNEGEVVTLTFQSTANNAQLGINVNNTSRTFGNGTSNPIATGSSTIAGAGETPTPTPTAEPAEECFDSGYYVLDNFGGRHRVGFAVPIVGSLYFGRDVAEDMEKVEPVLNGPVAVKAAITDPDLAVLDTFGAVQFVDNPGSAPGQTFYFPEGSEPEAGFAVDVEIANDSLGFWVLTERGGIFRAGTALPGGESAQLGNAAANLTAVLGIPFGGDVPRDPSMPASDGASIRAVGFVVVQSVDPAAPHGFVVLDSQGGHYTFDDAGNDLTDGVEGSILNAATVYPFFLGLDIARDIELAITSHVMVAKGVTSGGALAGLVIYDGWGGVHPVPVVDTPESLVGFLRNEGLTSVGLPYLKVGFDDPATAENEGNPAEVGFDVGSIFKDIEFCSTGSEGVYVLDGFGGVFTFGSTRLAPDNPTTEFTGSPYFFPNILAKDLEATSYAEKE